MPQDLERGPDCPLTSPAHNYAIHAARSRAATSCLEKRSLALPASSVSVGLAANGPANTSLAGSPYRASFTASNVQRTLSSLYHESRSEHNPDPSTPGKSVGPRPPAPLAPCTRGRKPPMGRAACRSWDSAIGRTRSACPCPEAAGNSAPAKPCTWAHLRDPHHSLPRRVDSPCRGPVACLPPRLIPPTTVQRSSAYLST